jgi:arylsulfatase A-like enzyme
VEERWKSGLRHVILIQADALRMDHLSLYGHDRPTTPLMEDQPWEIVEGYRSGAAWTLPWIASVMSAREPHENGIMTFHGSGTSALPAGSTLADAFRAAGYQTRLRSGNNFFVNGFGAEEGFDDTLYIKQKDHVGNLTELIDGALDGLDPSRPVFLVFQPMDAHGPYAPVPEDQGRWTGSDFPFSYDDAIGEHSITKRWEAAGARERQVLEQEVGALYDEQLPELDRAMGRLYGMLDRAGILQDALVVWAADHARRSGTISLASSATASMSGPPSSVSPSPGWGRTSPPVSASA